MFFMAMQFNMILIFYVISKLTKLYIYMYMYIYSIIFMTNKSVMTFLVVNKISVFLYM